MRGVLLIDTRGRVAAIHTKAGNRCLDDAGCQLEFSGHPPVATSFPVQAAARLAADFLADGGEIVSVLLNDRSLLYAPGFEYLPIRWCDFSLVGSNLIIPSVAAEMLAMQSTVKNTPLHVLHLFEGCGGGPFKLLTDLAPVLAGCGIRTTALAQSEPGLELKLPREMNVRYCDDQDLAGSFPTFDGFVRQRRLEEWMLDAAAELLQTDPYQLVHVHAGAGLAARALSSLRSIPVIVTPHVVEALMETHTGRLDETYRYYTPALVEQLRDRFRRERELIMSAEAVIGVSRALCREIVETFSIRQDKVHLIPGGITPDVAGDRDLAKHMARLSGGRRIISFAGSLNLVKGADRFFSIAARLLMQRSDLDFYVAGASWRGHDELTEWVKSLGEFKDRVHLLGLIRPDEVREMFRGSEIVLFPSRYESFGLACLEAMMEGAVPVVAAVGGLPERVTDEVDGRILAGFEVDEWCQVIQELLDNPRLEEISQAARTRAQAICAGAASEKLARLYQRVLE